MNLYTVASTADLLKWLHDYDKRREKLNAKLDEAFRTDTTVIRRRNIRIDIDRNLDARRAVYNELAARGVDVP